jgi:TolA-binding protein
MKSILALLTLLILVGCSTKKTDQELFDEAQTNLRIQKFPEAAMSFEELVNEHPDSKLAPEALSDLASIYQNKQINSISENENLVKAIQLFKRLHEDYPTSEYAPSGLFMAGFIYANELQDYKSATEIYKQFLADYPDNDLAESAQAELDNMGLSPEEILSRNLAKEK